MSERKEAERALVRFKDDPSSWTLVDTILERAQNAQTKFFALQILEEMVKSRWKIVTPPQRTSVKNYVVNVAIKLSSDEATLRANKILLRKLNFVLVQIIKQEWPKFWTSFIPEIVAASRTNESLCENNMEILSLLSEEIFEFGKDNMTRSKMTELKQSFNREFSEVFRLCEFVLERAQKPSLINGTLQTLLRFLNWIPASFIFETRLLETIVTKFFPVEALRVSALRCLAEVATIKAPPNQQMFLVQFFVAFMDQLKRGVLPAPEAIPGFYLQGNREAQHFVNHLALFFVGFLKENLVLIERGSPELYTYWLEAQNYLVHLTFVDEREILNVFFFFFFFYLFFFFSSFCFMQVCLEYWGFLASSLYHDTAEQHGNTPALLLGPDVSGSRARRERYAQILSRVRLVVIQRMAKPEEVLIVEDEHGDIVRERTKDTDQIVLYKVMRETLVYLTHLDPMDTQKIMLDLLQKVCDGRAWSWHNVNTLSWAIGSISGAQSEEAEKRFLIMVVKDLLTLTEIKQGKSNKAVIASDIMYVVGQYPRFLRAHWRFLRTVVMKLFEFMLELHPGVQDMAVDTFLKIAKSCKRKFVVLQVGESQPFVNLMVDEVQQHVRLLEPQQICVFYKALGVIIASCTDAAQQVQYLSTAMLGPNKAWVDIMQRAAAGTEELTGNPNVAKTLSNILKINTAICSPLGKAFSAQLAGLYRDMLNVYRIYSEVISNSLEQLGAKATGVLQVRLMRRVKRQVLVLISTYVEVSQEAQHVPQLLSAVLVDYPRCIPEARDSEVLKLISIVCTKLGAQISASVPSMFSAVFECSLKMLAGNFSDYPDVRAAFFEMLESIVTYQFPAMLTIAQQSGQHFKLVVDSIVWGLKHTDRNISECAVRTLLVLWKNTENGPPEFAAAFYRTYLLPLLQETLFVLTDTMHKSSFKSHVQILMMIFRAVVSGKVRVALSQDASVSNLNVVHQFTVNLLSRLPTLRPGEINAFVNKLMDPQMGPHQFSSFLRDFLVALKEFSAEDNRELFTEETDMVRAEKEARSRAIPGMLPPTDDDIDE
jgi:exportin-1